MWQTQNDFLLLEHVMSGNKHAACAATAPLQQQQQQQHRLQQQQHHISYTQAPLQRHTVAASSTWQQQRPLQSIKTETLAKMLLTKRPQQQQQHTVRPQRHANMIFLAFSLLCYCDIFVCLLLCEIKARQQQQQQQQQHHQFNNMQAALAGNKSLAKMCAL